jgi:hypothetical protein
MLILPDRKYLFVIRIGETRNTYKNLIGRNGGKAHGRFMRIWENRTKMDLEVIVCKNVDWMRLA